jgi:hypothetical protein
MTSVAVSATLHQLRLNLELSVIKNSLVARWWGGVSDVKVTPQSFWGFLVQAGLLFTELLTALERDSINSIYVLVVGCCLCVRISCVFTRCFTIGKYFGWGITTWCLEWFVLSWQLEFFCVFMNERHSDWSDPTHSPYLYPLTRGPV